MLKLLRKEFKLALHPTNLLFLGLSAMLMIPEYPYYVVFFYTLLGLFFVCLTGRENQDIEYSMLLPIRKRDIVKGRLGFAVCIEVMQAIVAIPFAALRQGLVPVANPVGMDANIALFGFAFAMMGMFNICFFTKYYKNPSKVGGAFVWSSVAVFLFIGVAETAAHIVPFMRDVLDTKDTMFIGAKLVTLAVGLAVYAALTALTYRISVKRFEKLDI